LHVFLRKNWVSNLKSSRSSVRTWHPVSYGYNHSSKQLPPSTDQGPRYCQIPAASNAFSAASLLFSLGVPA
jgi:hypothetical protein